MSPEKVSELRALALGNLQLPSSDVTEDLVDSLRTFLMKTDRTKAVIEKTKPDKRISIAKEFLHSEHSTGPINKRYFWPPKRTTPSEPEIWKELADFMWLDVGKVPRPALGTAKPKRPAPPTAIDPRPASQFHSQQSLREIELAAAAAKPAMDKCDEQDPTYTEEASDFVLDTSRETRRVNMNTSKTTSTNARAQFQALPNLIRDKHTPGSLSTAIPAHDEAKRRAAESNRASNQSPSASKQIRTPPQSDKRLGKRPISDISDVSDYETPFSNSQLRSDLPATPPPYAEPSRKRARLENNLDNTNVLTQGLALDESSLQFPSRSPVQPARQTVGRSHENPMAPRLSAEVHDSRDAQSDPFPDPVSPSNIDFESFYPSVTRPTADSGVQCEIAQPATRLADCIMIDLHGLQVEQLYDLPSMFLDQLSEHRKSQERIGTNQSRVRAVVLKDVEERVRKTMSGLKWA